MNPHHKMNIHKHTLVYGYLCFCLKKWAKFLFFIFYFLRDNLTKILEKILTQYFFYVLNHKFYLYMDFFHIKLDWISHMLLSMWKIYKIYIKNEFTLSTYVVFVI